MSLGIDDVFVKFECDFCNSKEDISVSSILLSGHPICTKCNREEEMEYNDTVIIPELGIE